MTSLQPVQVYGLSVPANGVPVPAIRGGDMPYTFRITMAAIDPTVKAAVNGDTASTFVGSTLKLLRVEDDEDDDDEDMDGDDMDDEDDIALGDLLGEDDSEEDEDDEDDDEDEDEDEEVNGGPSDPERSPRKLQEKIAAQRLKEALASTTNGTNADIEMDDATKLSKKAKGKAKAIGVEDESDDDDEDLDNDAVEEFVLCTLDPSQNYQQTLDITVREHEIIYFTATGTHTVSLTGNILVPEERLLDGSEDESDDDMDLMGEDGDDLLLEEDEDESDELDNIADPRIEEVNSDEEAPPALVAAANVDANMNTKGKNKRAADDADEDMSKASLDELLAKGDEKKLSKKQLKKLKNNAGKPVEAAADKVEEAAKPSPGSKDKKVQFAKTLVQGPSNPSATKVDTKAAPAKAEAVTNGVAKTPTKPSPGVKTVQGVTIDDKKVGTGPASKKGDKVSMRYIGKLEKDKKVFDSNKKGKPFTFQLGAQQVIKGWEIGVQGMCVGGERRLVIPPHLAYGSKAMPDIPSNSTLVFDVKLLEIK